MKKKWITAPLASLALSACGGGAEELPVEEPEPERETAEELWQSKVYRLDQVGVCEEISTTTDFVDRYACDIEIAGAQGVELPMNEGGKWYVRYVIKDPLSDQKLYRESNGVRTSPDVLALSGVITLAFSLGMSTDLFDGAEACWSPVELTSVFFARDKNASWCVELQ